MSQAFSYIANKLRLPSEGIPYDASMGLVGGDSVVVRKWTTGDNRDIQNVLKTQDIHKVYTWCLDRLLIEPDPKTIPLDNFLISDVLCIMYMAKIWTWGSMADYPYECRCYSKQKPQIDIGQLLCKYPEDIEGGFSARNLQLVIEGKRLAVHLPTLNDTKKVGQFIKDLQRTNTLQDEDTDSGYAHTAILIDEIDGKQQQFMKSKFNTMMEWDMASIEQLNKFVLDQDTGLIMDQIEVNCTSCGRMNTIDLSLSPAFFRPPVARSNNNGEKGTANDGRRVPVLGQPEDDAARIGSGV